MNTRNTNKLFTTIHKAIESVDKEKEIKNFFPPQLFRVVKVSLVLKFDSLRRGLYVEHIIIKILSLKFKKILVLLILRLVFNGLFSWLAMLFAILKFILWHHRFISGLTVFFFLSWEVVFQLVCAIYVYLILLLFSAFKFFCIREKAQSWTL